MKKILESEYYIVFDDWLPAGQFDKLWEHFKTEEFNFVKGGVWNTVNRLLDGNSLYGHVKFSERTDIEVPLECFPPFISPYDFFFRSISNQLGKIKKVVGSKGVHWKCFSARAYIYPAGSGLSWHNDDSGYSGAYVFYIHPHWNCQWGGELLIGNKSAYKIKYQQGKQNSYYNSFNLENDFENEQIMKSGTGTYVLPKPNRIIFLKAGIHHMIKKVDSAAGDHARCSIAGFFVR